MTLFTFRKSLSLSQLQITYLALVSGRDERQRLISARVSNSIIVKTPTLDNLIVILSSEFPSPTKSYVPKVGFNAGYQSIGNRRELCDQSTWLSDRHRLMSKWFSVKIIIIENRTMTGWFNDIFRYMVAIFPRTVVNDVGLRTGHHLKSVCSTW